MWYGILKHLGPQFSFTYFNFNSFWKVNNFDLIFNNVLLIVERVLYFSTLMQPNKTLIVKWLPKLLFCMFHIQIKTLTNYNSFPSISAAQNNVSLNLLISQTTKYYHIIILLTVCTAEYFNASINNIQFHPASHRITREFIL